MSAGMAASWASTCPLSTPVFADHSVERGVGGLTLVFLRPHIDFNSLNQTTLQGLVWRDDAKVTHPLLLAQYFAPHSLLTPSSLTSFPVEL